MNNNMDILAKNRTLTTQFLLPLLFGNKIFTDILTDFDSFVNAYIADVNELNHENKIILVFKTIQKNLPELNRMNHYVKEIKGEVLFFYVYEIPNNLSENYSLWVVGKYSMFTDMAKQIILNFWEAGDNTLLYGALYKKGLAIPTFYKKLFNKNILDRWINEDEEWWITPSLSHESVKIFTSQAFSD
jgi:hypothetical protein